MYISMITSSVNVQIASHTFEATWLEDRTNFVGYGSFNFNGTVASGEYTTTAELPSPPGARASSTTGSSTPWKATRSAADLTNGYIDVYVPPDVFLPVYAILTCAHDITLLTGIFSGASRLDYFAPSTLATSAAATSCIRLEKWNSNSFEGPSSSTTCEQIDVSGTLA
eukprot:TRINITY_DN10562_c0_g1_i1.p1 TRINITY_DN10562_c0_g1~~TRINITY_DN10562_c0_g1_i1.p1  ORF type:complete len:168 (-),score=20.79 TRINITY_DN10562_c0_g1_i1:622-1125(-)